MHFVQDKFVSFTFTLSYLRAVSQFFIYKFLLVRNRHLLVSFFNKERADILGHKINNSKNLGIQSLYKEKLCFGVNERVVLEYSEMKRRI